MQRPPLRVIAATCALGVVTATAALLFLSHAKSASASAARPSAASIAAIQERYGARFTMVGLTANGGILDVRFIAVDADKLAQLEHGGARIKLVAEDSGRALNSQYMAPMFGKIRPGSQYFVLLRNDANTLHQGDLVTIKLGNLALEHMRVL